jgi:hypothetical protein
MLTLRLVVVLVLTSLSNASFGRIIRLDLSGEVIQAAGTLWRGPGPVPQSFHGTIVIDSRLFGSRDIHFEELDPKIGPRLESYRFVDVDVPSLSIVADGSALWSSPSGLTLTFAGDNASARGLGGYFSYIGGKNSAGQSVLLNYDTFPGLTEEQARSQGDVLANILLSGHPTAASTFRFILHQGQIAGPLDIRMVAIPEPAAIRVFLAGLITLALAVRPARARLEKRVRLKLGRLCICLPTQPV